MNLNFPSIRTLFRAEMRMVLRDRRLLVTSILLPMLLTPLLFLGSSRGIKHREKKLEAMVCRYAVTGPQAAKVRELLKATRERIDRSPENKESKGTFKFEEVAGTNASAALAKGDIHIVLEGLDPADAAPKTKAKQPRSEDEDKDENDTKRNGLFTVRIVYRGNRDESASCMSRMQAALRDTRLAQRAELLKARGFPVPPAEMAVVTEKDVAIKGQVAGLALGRGLTVFLLLFILSSGAVVATDSLAGEKERGTLETLLTTGMRRVEIIAAKHVLILAVALLVTLVQVANLLVYAQLKLLPMPGNAASAISPGKAILLFLLFLPLAALAGSVLLLISGRAKTYKEAQIYFFPVFLIALLPALAPFLPGLSLRSAIVLLPVANIALAVKEILSGVFNWPMIALSWIFTAAAAAWATRASVRLLSEERLIIPAQTDVTEFTGGPALFERHVLGWFAVLWAVLLLVNNYLEKADVRAQLFVNLAVLFFGATCLMIWRYRLEPRVALALRAPKPAIWLGVVLAVPGGLLSAYGLARLANLFVPVPEKMFEDFRESVMPPGISLAQLLFFLAVMPGLFEEVAFRGLLLHGLRRKFHPAALALVVGLVFGLFHMALFRLAATAWLGVLLAAVTLLTGSLYPAMVWHCLSNAASILAARSQVPLEELDPVSYAAGGVMLLAAFWVIWRNRTPYPGLRPWSRGKPKENQTNENRKSG
jgi:ABC-type Na+ efflux pump permease subunit/membrane protease YdiL (CAAX protease family)